MIAIETEWLSKLEQMLLVPPRPTADAEEISEEQDVRLFFALQI